MPFSPGERLGDYEIQALVGRGSMGEVYRARDLELDRDVAIKVLPEHFATDPERLHRFEQEARAASALNHPNIVTIYEIGSHHGTPYIVMEYVHGTRLLEAIDAGPFDADRLIRYLAQMAEGLAKAHQAGIVHRDLKPENIFISDDDYIKILDFGLAKLIPPRPPDPEARTLVRDTLPGMVVGTPGYLSPEQARGQSASFRSDQFSLGVVAYEMATAKRPFERDTAAQTLAAIIEHDPQPVTALNPRVPGRVASVIDRCLSKDPERRYDSTWELAKAVRPASMPIEESPHRRPLAAIGAAGALVAILVVMFGLLVSDVRDWAGGGESLSIESIAVLPLENLSGNPEQEYFADGMTEALIADLSRISALRVISRRSVMRFKGSEEPLPEIARVLDVDAIVEGTVLRVDDEVRITAQLIHGSTDEHIWSESYDRDLENVLALLSEVARVIADEIEVVVTPEQRAHLSGKSSVDPDVQETYLRARFFLNRVRDDDVERARALFQETIERDAAFARGYSGLAVTEVLSAFLGLSSDDGALARATDAAERALELDPSIGEAYSALGLVQLYYDRDWVDAERTLRRAVELSPNDSIARHGLADYLLITGDVDASVRQVDLARRFDPLSPLAIVPVIAHRIFARRYDEAIDHAEAMLELFPEYDIHGFVATARWHQGSTELALAEYRAMWGEQSPLSDAMSRAYREEGPEAAMRAVADALAARADGVGGSPLPVASFYAAAGDADSAFTWLNRALDERTPQLLHIDADPTYDRIRDDPRFRTVLNRMNLPR